MCERQTFLGSERVATTGANASAARRGGSGGANGSNAGVSGGVGAAGGAGAEKQTALEVRCQQCAIASWRRLMTADAQSLPPALLLHVARFAFVDGAARKLSTRVRFGLELDVPREFFSTFVQSTMRSSARYRLRGVVRHHGVRAGDGHYTATVRRLFSRLCCPLTLSLQVLVRKPATRTKPSSNDWFLFNDTVVEPIRSDEVSVVFASSGHVALKRRREQVLRATDTCYLLMYERLRD